VASRSLVSAKTSTFEGSRGHLDPAEKLDPIRNPSVARALERVLVRALAGDAISKSRPRFLSSLPARKEARGFHRDNRRVPDHDPTLGLEIRDGENRPCRRRSR